ncbi:MAG: carboxypeptidase-like regulatory domain-containing protein [Jiangellaceae bacterium]
MSIRGLVRTPDGEPVAEARVFYTESPVPMPDVAALSGVDGRFELSTPAAGRYTIGSVLEGYGSSTVTVVVEADRPAEVEITMQPER